MKQTTGRGNRGNQNQGQGQGRGQGQGKQRQRKIRARKRDGSCLCSIQENGVTEQKIVNALKRIKRLCENAGYDFDDLVSRI